MIKIEKFEVMGWVHAIRGMRNALESWEKSDSFWQCTDYDSLNENDIYEYEVGPNDHDLMMRLVKAGDEHSKFMRMIHVSMDILAPLYWWKQADTYKIGFVTNSCSTMHKIHAKEFTRDDFSSEHIMCLCEKETPIVYYPSGNTALDPIDVLDITIMMLNKARDLYLQTKDKQYWWQLIQLLPDSYNQLRTCDTNYATLRKMYHQRKGHKLDEWNDFRAWVEELPYSELITGCTESISG